MGLLPEFFMMLAIDIFLAMSLLSAVLDDDLPSRLQYLFQVAAIAGLGQLVMIQGFISGQVFGRDPTDLTRFWISVLYLALAVTSVVGLNVYLAVVRRKMALASIFSGTVALPILMVSALLVSSFLGTGGEVSLTSALIIILVVSAPVISLGIFRFLRESSKHIRNAPGGRGSSPLGPVSMLPGAPGMDLPLHPRSMRGEEWEESPKKEDSEE